MTPDGLHSDLPVRVSDLSPEDRDFLRAIADAGGEATTHEIKAGSALERNQVHTRYEKFGREGYGLVDVERVGSDQGGFNQNTAVLTDAGERLLDSGLLDKIDDPNANIAEVRERLDGLDSRVDSESRRSRSIANDLADLEHRVEELEIWHGDLAHTDDVLADRVEDLEKENQRLRERVEELAAVVER